jgi:hypothetical protein
MNNGMHRRIGIPGVDKAPWGEHLCVFFNSKEELLSLTVPYIKAGLEDNECCIWITGDPITEKDAFQALEGVLPDAHKYLAKKQLEILPSAQWYLPTGKKFDIQVVLENWKYREQRAEAGGFNGIRITGNPVWLQSEEDWAQFAKFEEAVHERIATQKVVALCTYPVWICQGQNVRRTLSSHTAALMSNDAQWRRLELS